MLVSLVLLVMAPLAGTIYYLYAVAQDQYASKVGFSVRSEEMSSALDLLGGLTSFSGTSSSDTDILYEYIQSQELIAKINEDIDLEAIFSRPEFDPVFAYDPSGTIEDLVIYWPRMINIDYDRGTSLIELRVQAFRPEDAKKIAGKIVEEATAKINRLSAIARADTTRYARTDLQRAVERLKSARETLTRFRSETRIIDPVADLQSQMGLLSSLEMQLAEAQIEINLLTVNTPTNDPRRVKAQQRITVIEMLIENERAKFGIGGSAHTDSRDYTTLVGDFERIMVDMEYAQKSYLGAQAVFDTAQAEAHRQTRYLAIYASPTLAESSRYPQRALLSLITGIFLLLMWSVLILIYYSLRDRR